MTPPTPRLQALSSAQLAGMRRGVEKEGLRVRPDGTLATTPHPAALGSALTHPHITTDFSESQLELVTGVHDCAESCLAELAELHQVVARAIGDECMWVGSMPCTLPGDDEIPLGRYGSSHIGQAKTIYRRGLGYRYGRRMQTICGIHYNWSLPGLDNDQYFALIRNVRRQAFVLLLLFGASPAVERSFVEGLPHGLEPLGDDTLYLPWATSLRMGKLGYQSDAQASLAVSYNDLEGYGASLQEALTRRYPAYEAIGLQGPDGEYRQLSTTLLQIENEFYGTIRPKRPIRSGERPLHALRERGVEYVEVRCIDLNPFEDAGLSADTMRVLDAFLLHCLTSDSPPDSPQENAELARNQHLTAARGREPGLRLERGGRTVALTDWAAEVLEGCLGAAERLDAVAGGSLHAAAVRLAMAGLREPDTLPSARVLHALRDDHGGQRLPFLIHRSRGARQAWLERPMSTSAWQRWTAMAEASRDAQARLEAQQTGSFEAFRRDYLSLTQLA